MRLSVTLSTAWITSWLPSAVLRVMKSYPEIHSNEFALPEPDADAIAVSEQLVGKIVQQIEQHGGVIGFDEYMRMALYEPGFGYYAAGSTKLGAAGDFVTAPEISALFGECLARQTRQLVEQGCAPEVLEFGAGSGALCGQILQAFPGLERYRILEPSPDLKQRQRDALRKSLDNGLFDKIEWLSRLPEDFSGIVIANEVLDAMPVHLVEKRENWVELGIGFAQGRFHWQSMPPDSALHSWLVDLETRMGGFARGYRSEINLNYLPWMQSLSELGRTDGCPDHRLRL